MSQVHCAKCNGLWPLDQSSTVGARCGTRAVPGGWAHCDGILVEHQCGGSSEACGIRDCEECHPPQKVERDALWHTIYAAEFVRLCGDMTMSGYADEKIRGAASEAKALADWHHEVVPKEER